MPESNFAESAAEAARLGGAILIPHFRNLPPGSIDEKGKNDFVSRADRESEAAIFDFLRARHPRHALLGEEGGFRPFSEGLSEIEGEWIVDPLDGTANFVHGFPVFSVSVGLRRKGEIVAGAVFDPLRGDLWIAERGGGATWNGQPMKASAKCDIAEAFVATGFPFRARNRIDPYLALFKDVFLEGRAIRRAGSAALDLAYTACGVFDAFFELRLSPWDIAAGSLLVEEAGGVISDLDGGGRHLDRGSVLAAGRDLHPALLAIARRHFKESDFDQPGIG
jgi:myo-inositol-1(or 4)-monophosphatase